MRGKAVLVHVAKHLAVAGSAQLPEGQYGTQYDPEAYVL